MKNYKYVKFSEETAKINPEMIIREYEELIERAKISKNVSSIMYIFEKMIENEGIKVRHDFCYSSYNDKELSKSNYKKLVSVTKKLNSFCEKAYREMILLKEYEKELKRFKKEFKRYIK